MSDTPGVDLPDRNVMLLYFIIIIIIIMLRQLKRSLFYGIASRHTSSQDLFMLNF